MQLLRLCFLVVLIGLTPASAIAQLIKSSPPRDKTSRLSADKNARRHAVHPLSLPFWDDFSSAKEHTADSLLWIVNDKVFVNNGQAINPPSINVATFDGYNENGLPYSNLQLETGYGDTLESQPIKMADVAAIYRDKIYLSFFYQPGGNSEMPNPTDYLKLEFKSVTGWVEVARFQTIANADPSIFYDTAIQIPQALVAGEPNYFHNQFQFRFTSFGRLSGQYDAWHLDYVYLNRRISNDMNTNISDRTLTKPLSSVFGDYFSIPYRHFKLNPDDYLEDLVFEVFNLKDTSFNQVLNYDIAFKLNNYKESMLLSSHVETGFNSIDEIEPRTRRDYQISNRPTASNFDATADSVALTIDFRLGSGDQKPPNAVPAGDYYSRYFPINFLENDSLKNTISLSNYYAYDDGVAEYIAGVAKQGNQLAYRFVMNENIARDTLNGVYIYFPYTANTPPETMQLYVFRDKAGKPDSAFQYSQTVSVTRTANSIFSEINFTKGVLVRDTFYIGYLEPVSGTATHVWVGLDGSHDTGENIYIRNTVYHPWVQNDEVQGSLMIRPRFGKGSVVTGIEDEPDPVSVYPNPNRGEFYLKGRVDTLHVMTLTGQSISFSSENLEGAKKVTLQGAVPGMYIIRYRSGSNVFAKKILVTEN